MIVNFFKSAILAVKGMALKIKDSIIPSKLSNVKISGKKSKFTKGLGLAKYEQQEIPLPRVTERKFHEEDKKREYEINAQTYYLFQFIHFERDRQKKRIKELATKDVAEFISILHYLSYKKNITLKTGSFSPTLYKLNSTSIEYPKNTISR